MPVKLSDVKGLMLDYISPEVKVKAVENSDYVRYGYNQALSLQSEVCIGLNREKLAKIIKFEFDGIIVASDGVWLQCADAIISEENNLIESKGRNGEK